MAINGGLVERVEHHGDCYAPRYPPAEQSRGAAILVISTRPQTARGISGLLFKAGYAALPVNTLVGAHERVLGTQRSYLEAIVLDVDGNVPQEYGPRSEALTFLENVKDAKSPLHVILINSGKSEEQSRLAIDDLVHKGGVTLDNNPFDVTELLKGTTPGTQTQHSEFLEAVRKSVEQVLGEQQKSLVAINTHISSPTQPAGELPLTIGSKIADVYRTHRQGGAAHFLTGAINGVALAVPIDPTKQYPHDASTFHIKPMSAQEIEKLRGMQEFLIRNDPERNIPLLKGWSIEGDNAFALQSFLIASNYTDIRNALDPKNPQLAEEDRQLAAQLWKAALDLFFTQVYPEWYRDTHGRVMEEDHRAAREATGQRQIDKIMLFPTNTLRISGKSLPPDVQQGLLAATVGLYNKIGKADDTLSVLPMDPKGANIGLLTYQSIPTPQLLFELFTKQTGTGREVNRQALAKAFAHWDFKPLGAAYPLFVDLWQTLLDPTLGIPEKDRPVYLARSLEATLPSVDPSSLLIEMWRQGLYKSALKAFVQVAHAQVNEGRLLRMKLLDYDKTVETRESLQRDVNYFLEQTLKFASGLYAAIAEGHAEKPGPFGLERMVEHFNDKARWETLGSPLTTEKPELADLRTIHDAFTKIIREGLGTFNPALLRNGYREGNLLKY